MPISSYKLPQNMRMSVSSQQLLQELALKANCKYNPDKEEIKEYSKDSMQCLGNNLSQEEISKQILTQTKVVHQEFCKEEDSVTAQNTAFTEKGNECKSVTTFKSRRNFIPYPDHNYGQQPPLTPPAEGGKLIVHSFSKVETNSPQAVLQKASDETSVTKCICGFEHDDGYMICCDDCSSWQHIECMGIQSTKVPETYSCHKCLPRELDIEKAKAIQAKKREKMSEGDDDEEEETASEDEAGRTMYTAISNTPTRITLLSNPSNQAFGKPKNKKGRVQKRKLADSRNSRPKKNRKKDKIDTVSNENIIPFIDCDSFTDYLSSHKQYEEIQENKYDEEFQNMHFKLPEVVPPIDFTKVVKNHSVLDVTENRKGIVASCHIPEGNFLLEYKGIIVSKPKFEHLNPVLEENCPYVVNYNKIDILQLVIDSRDFGNDARFVRRCCTPNAELQHVTSNGALHFMIISCVNIVKDDEVTIPFDYPVQTYKGYIECACKSENCVVREHNADLLKLDNLENVLANQDVAKVDANDSHQESENESSLLNEEGKHEKLSREERKLQALVKQFEKLEKKQDTVKKMKDPKTPNSRSTSTEDNSNICVNVNIQLQKPPLTKKISGSKRKPSTTTKRRTRQSSCSSEPVSPVDQESNSALSTPTTPLSHSHPQAMFEVANLAKTKVRKESLTLTLPIQRRMRNEQLVASPTPPTTPLMQASPARSLDDSSSFMLSLDTNSFMESSPLKSTLQNGLLQIAPNSLSASFASSACPTSEEKIGDLTARLSACQPPSPAPHILNYRQEQMPRRYYGSLKKHWLRKHTPAECNQANGQSNGLNQISLAALVASLSHQRYMENMLSAFKPTPIFKRPQSCVPLKKRFLYRSTPSISKPSDTSATLVQQVQVKVKSEECSIRVTEHSAAGSTKNGSIENLQLQKTDTTPCASIQDATLPLNRTVISLNNVLNRTAIGKSAQNNLETIDRNIKNNGNNMTSSIKRSYDPGSIQPSINMNEPLVKRQRQNYFNESTVDVGLKINETDPSSTKDGNCSLPPTNAAVSVEQLSITTRPHLISTSVAELKQSASINPRSVSVEQLSIMTQPQLISTSVPEFKQSASINPRSVSVEQLSITTQPQLISTSVAELKQSASINPRSVSVEQLSIMTQPQLISTSVAEFKQSASINPRSVPSSPRSSVDSNPDADQTSSTGKKKLSYREYRNRQRSQKFSTNPPTSQSSVTQMSAPNNLTNHEMTSDSVVTSTQNYLLKMQQSLNINKTADMLLTPRTVSLTDPMVSKISSPVLKTFNVVASTLHHEQGFMKLSSSAKLDSDSLKISTEKTQPLTNDNVFEPVSPVNDVEPAKNVDNEKGFTGHTIHSDITKNPFSIHNDITKNPFGKKQNQQQGTGLLQYLSAQKYPHLAALSNPTPKHQGGTPTAGGRQSSNSNHYRTHGLNEYHSSETVENEDDTSSTHSSVSSTSYGSGPDLAQDRIHANHHRPFSRESGSNESREFYPNQHHPTYPTVNQSFYPNYNQNPHQNQHPSRSLNPQRRNPGYNNFSPATSPASRQRPSHRGYPPFQ